MSRIAVEVQEGRYIDYVPSGDVAVGDVVPLTNVCGVAMTDIATGATGVLALEGIWTVPGVSGTVFAVGDVLYWDASAKNATKTATDNTPLGIAMTAKLSAGTTCKVRLGAFILKVTS